MRFCHLQLFPPCGAVDTLPAYTSEVVVGCYASYMHSFCDRSITLIFNRFNYFHYNMSQENISHTEAYRKALVGAVGAICVENGCDSIKKSALETLTEILQSFLTEAARNTRQYCEVGGRSTPTLCDIQTALADNGFNISSIPEYLQLKRRVVLSDPIKSTQTQNANVLLVGEKRVFPNFVPDNSSYPKFPDPHTYIRTRTGQCPEENYGILRERGSLQRWDVERALTKFIAKTGSNHPLLPDDKSAFPLIAAVPPAITYLSALLPYDNDIRKAQATKQDEAEKSSDSTNSNMPNAEGNTGENTSKHERTADSKTEDIHNPYLRPPKMPKLKKRKK